MSSLKVPSPQFISLLCALLCMLLSCVHKLEAANASSHGTDFFIAFSKNQWQTETLKLFITTRNTNDVAFLVNSQESESFSFVGSAENGSITEVSIPATFKLQGINDRQKGLWIRPSNAQETISVVALKSTNLGSGGYLALPSNTYSDLQEYTYYGVSYPKDDRLEWDVQSGVLLVGSYDNTRITISPTQQISIPSDLRVDPTNYRTVIYPGESYTIILNSLETFGLESSQDLTGTKVTSNRPITVLSSHECVDIPQSIPFCDHIVEQIPPTVSWGRFFLVTSLHTRTSGERYKVMASKSYTRITVRCIRNGHISPETNTTTFVINSAGQTREFPIGSHRYCSIQATKPVMVMQLSLGFSLDETGDPFMLFVPPVEQFTNNLTINSPSNFQNHLSIVVPLKHFDPARIFAHGGVISSLSWSPIFCSQSEICGYGATVGVPVGVTYVYHSNPEARIGVFAYGFAHHSGFGYPAGMELNHIAEMCVHGSVRLVAITSPPSRGLGRVEVCLSGAWSSVCGGGWDTNDAAVLCRQLGYNSNDAVAFISQPPTDVTTFPFLFTNAQCLGTELNLFQCSYTSTISQCTSGRVAYAQCEAFAGPSVTTRVEGVIYLGQPATISCTAQFEYELWSESQVELTWSKDGAILQTTNGLLITQVVQVAGTNSYQSNVLVDSISNTNSGVYTCTSTAYLPLTGDYQITATGIGATLVTTEALESQLIQLRLIGVGQCSVWLYQISDPTEKVSQVVEAIIDGANQLCSPEACGLSSDYFTDSAFQCFSQNAHEVTFRTRIHNTAQASTTQLINAILQWVDNGAVMSVSGVILTADPQCDITIESISEPECSTTTQHPITVTTTSTTTTRLATQGPLTTLMTSSSEGIVPHTITDSGETVASTQAQMINIEAIIAAVGALGAVLICAVLICVVTISCLCIKHKGRSQHHLPREPISAVNPFPPPAYTVTAGGPQEALPSVNDAKKELPDYAELENYWENYAEPRSTTV